MKLETLAGYWLSLYPSDEFTKDVFGLQTNSHGLENPWNRWTNSGWSGGHFIFFPRWSEEQKLFPYSYVLSTTSTTVYWAEVKQFSTITKSYISPTFCLSNAEFSSSNEAPSTYLKRMKPKAGVATLWKYWPEYLLIPIIQRNIIQWIILPLIKKYFALIKNLWNMRSSNIEILSKHSLSQYFQAILAYFEIWCLNVVWK